MIWRCTNTGVFSVKSAYHLAKELITNSTPESSVRIAEKEIWRVLWRLPLTNAEKNFMWRACQNLLPTKDNLLRRKVVTEPCCPICCLEAETLFHILWDCPSARDVWGVSKRIFQKYSHGGPEFLQVAEDVLMNYGQENLCTFIRTARKIWFKRNGFVHGEELTPPNIIVRDVQASTEEFNRAPEVLATQIAIHQAPPIMVWSKPPIHWWKANWDFAVDRASRRMGMGIVVRDTKGEVVAARCLMRQGLLDPTAGEALTSLKAASLCQELGGQAIILEGDAKNVVEAINSDADCGNRFGHLVQDTRQILQTFPRWKCVYVNRSGNVAAHTLAKVATKLVVDRDWVGITPDCIHDTIESEKISPLHD